MCFVFLQVVSFDEIINSDNLNKNAKRIQKVQIQKEINKGT